MASFLAGLDAVEIVVPCGEDNIVRRIGQSPGGPTYAGLMVPNEWKYVPNVKIKAWGSWQDSFSNFRVLCISLLS